MSEAPLLLKVNFWRLICHFGAVVNSVRHFMPLPNYPVQLDA